MPRRKRKAETKTASAPKKTKLVETKLEKTGKVSKEKKEPADLVQKIGNSMI